MKKEYKFTKSQEQSVFKLILKNTIDKDIQWSTLTSMYCGMSGNNKILFYEGDLKAISIQNKNEYTHFYINKDQALILRDIISGKNINRIEQQTKGIEAAQDYYIAQ